MESVLRSNSIPPVVGAESVLHLNLSLLAVGLELALRSNSILLVAGSGFALYLIPMVAGFILLKFLTQILEIVLMTQLNCFHSTFQQMRSLLRKLNIFCFLTHSTC